MVLLAIADHAHDDGGGAYPSIDTLAFKSRLSTRQVKRVLHELVESGELVIEPNAGPRGANLYTVTFERGEEKEEAGGDKMSPLTEPAGGEEAEGDIPGKVGPEFDPEKGNIQSCDSDFSTALTPLEARSLGAAKCGAGCDILGQTGKECHGDISDNSWGHLGPEGVTFSTGGVTFSTVLGDTAMSPEPLEPSIKPSTEPLINCQGAREKIPEKTDPVPSIAVEAVEATGGPDIPPPRRRRPSEPRTPPTVTEEFRARMRQKHLGEGFDVNTEIDRALNHEAVLKAIKVELYVQNWLRRQAQ